MIIPQNDAINGLDIPEDLIEVLKKVNQNLNLKVELGAGLDDLLKDEDPVIQYAEKGLKISANISLVTNIKDSILEVLKNADGEMGEEFGEDTEKSTMLKMIAPLFMMKF